MVWHFFQKKILVANRDPAKPVWYIYDVNGDSLTNGKMFYDASGLDKSWNGLPDGFKIDKNGMYFYRLRWCLYFQQYW